MSASYWYKNAIFYEVYIRAFADGNGDGHGDFIGLTQRLDYFQELGVDCLWLLPMYPSPLKDDGYDIADYYNIHPDYGTLEDFKVFLREAHARGLRVIADLVVNHTSDQHPWFQAARSDRNSPYRDYYVWSDTDQKYQGTRIIFLDTERSNWTWDEQAVQYYWHRFYSHQPDLNYDNPAVQEEMLNVMRFWLEMGLDGFRVDAVPYLFEREGTNCENLPETHAYLKKMRRFVEENFPDAILLAEANQWPWDLRPYFGDGDEFHLAFHFPLMPRLYLALAQRNAAPIVNILAQTPPIPENCQWCTFLRNHDELTLEMVTPEEREFLWNYYAPHPRMRLNLGIRRRLAPLMEGDVRKITLLHSLLFSLPGSPVLYYGDEIGMGDNIWLPDRNGVRTPMQWDASPGAGFSIAPAERFYAPLIQEGPFDYHKVNLAVQKADPNSLWHTLRRMIAIRKAHPALGQGDYRLIYEPTLPSFLGVVRQTAQETILALHNLSDNPLAFTLPLPEFQGRHWQGVLNEGGNGQVPAAGLSVCLEPYQYRWIEVR
ncbi:maltose alpha-D-glucosyltransferase [Thermanaerothrix sp.]|uniref:maltose alpha-D-glucosyltransferase n=1 Tax=Thermanaerothrix sp. TaxID=2972675 RepID=UPI002ADE3ECC|nr:maltose alpha-D-glucosyltransferase [Thermanaerothrix sp.]